MSLFDTWSKDPENPVTLEQVDITNKIMDAVSAERERCALITDAYRQAVESVMPNPVAQEFCEGQVVACKSIAAAIRKETK